MLKQEYSFFNWWKNSSPVRPGLNFLVLGSNSVCQLNSWAAHVAENIGVGKTTSVFFNLPLATHAFGNIEVSNSPHCHPLKDKHLNSLDIGLVFPILYKHQSALWRVCPSWRKYSQHRHFAPIPLAQFYLQEETRNPLNSIHLQCIPRSLCTLRICNSSFGVHLNPGW